MKLTYAHHKLYTYRLRNFDHLSLWWLKILWRKLCWCSKFWLQRIFLLAQGSWVKYEKMNIFERIFDIDFLNLYKLMQSLADMKHRNIEMLWSKTVQVFMELFRKASTLPTKNIKLLVRILEKHFEVSHI